MSVFGVILVRIFLAFSRIQTEYGEILRISPYLSPNAGKMRQYLSVFSPNAGKRVKNADQNNSEYGHFLRSDHFTETHFIFSIFVFMSRPRSIFVVSVGSVFDF